MWFAAQRLLGKKARVIRAEILPCSSLQGVHQEGKA